MGTEEDDTMAFSIKRIAGVWSAAIVAAGQLLQDSFATRAQAIAWLQDILDQELAMSHGAWTLGVPHAVA